MNDNNFIAICGPDKGPHMALSRDGGLYIRRSGAWESFDFNAMYRGYYPACRFTALEYGNGFWLGAESDGAPYLFTSLMGGVWTMRSIDMSSFEGGELMPSGRILRVLWDGKNRQAHLIMSSGQLITLPDCAKCVRIRTVAEDGISGGRLDGRDAVLTRPGGCELRVPLDDLMQLRVAWSWAWAHISRGALVYDLRLEGERQPGDLPWPCLWMDADAAWDSIRAGSTEQWAFILCRRGLKADVLTKKAREGGFINVWSLGGSQLPFHVE